MQLFMITMITEMKKIHVEKFITKLVKAILLILLLNNIQFLQKCCKFIERSEKFNV